METLPYEMVLKIGRQLTPKDLAHCCGVSKGWREAFNQDWLWKPHCDAALEEPLRCTPSVVEPVFVIPGGEDSTLAPLCQWRLAFLREKHLWGNWKHNYRRTECVLKLEGEIYRDFFANTLVVRYFPKHIEVWDVTVDPAVFVARTDPSVIDIAGWIDCFSETGLLVITQIGSVKVLFVDAIKKIIQLKLEISLDDVKSEPVESGYVKRLKDYSKRREKSGLDCVKANFFIHVNVGRSKLDIFDLETGMKIKEEPCPTRGGLKTEISRVSTSRTSDYVAVELKVKREGRSSYLGKHLFSIYNPQKSGFVRDFMKYAPVNTIDPDYGELHGHYFAVTNKPDEYTVYDCHSSKSVLRTDVHSKIGFYSPGQNDNFLYQKPDSSTSITKFDLASSATTTIDKVSPPGGSTHCAVWLNMNMGNDNDLYKVFNRKLLACAHPEFGWYLLMDNVWVKCDIPFEDISTINRAFTKVISLSSKWMKRQEWYIYHYW